MILNAQQNAESLKIPKDIYLRILGKAVAQTQNDIKDMESALPVNELPPISTPPTVVAIQPSVSVELAQAAVLSCSQANSGGAYSAMPVMIVQPMTKTVSQPPMRLHHSRERSL